MKKLFQNVDELGAYAIALAVMVTTMGLPLSLIGYVIVSQRAEVSQVISPMNRHF
jgi:hypothetical protein